MGDTLANITQVAGSLKLLETSLKLLKTDHVDLWQLHAMSTMDDVEKVFAKGGALEAFQQAREQKLVRFLGLSGHTAAAPSSTLSAPAAANAVISPRLWPTMAAGASRSSIAAAASRPVT